MEYWSNIFPSAPKWAVSLYVGLLQLADAAARQRDERNWIRASEAASRLFDLLNHWQPDLEEAVTRSLLEAFTGYTVHVR